MRSLIRALVIVVVALSLCVWLQRENESLIQLNYVHGEFNILHMYLPLTEYFMQMLI